MAHPYDPYIPTEDEKEYMKEQYDKLKKKKGKNKWQVNKFSGQPKTINNA